MKGDDIFDIPIFTDSGDPNPSLIQRIQSDFGKADEQLNTHLSKED